MAKKPGLGERECPKCKETIKADALICKHCRTEFTPDEVAQAKQAAKSDSRMAGIGCLLLVLLLGFCSYTLSGDGTQKSDIPEKPAPTAKADVIAFYKAMMDSISGCDAAGKSMARAGSANDAVGVYQAASLMESACLGTPSAIRAIDVPPSVGKDAHSKLTETKKVCENAYLAKWSSAGKMKDALDGGGIAKLAALKEETQMAQAGTLACAAGLVGEAMTLGASDKDLGGD
jgi:hypothetical protein